MRVRDLLRPRRILMATFLFILLSGASALAGADGSWGTRHSVAAGPLPAAFALPQGRVGDRGNYTWDRIQFGQDGGAAVLDEHEAWGFEWLPPQAVRDLDGRLHDANLLHEWGWQRCTHGCVAGQLDTQGWERYAEPVFALDRNDRGVVAYAYLSGASVDPNQRNEAGPTAQIMLEGPQGHVGSRSGCTRWQGRDVPLDRDVMLLQECSLLGSIAYSVGGPYKAIGTQEVDGRTTVLFAHIPDPSACGSCQDRAAYVWYDPEVPVPVRAAVQDPADDLTFDVVRLTRFERGTEPLVWQGDQPGEPAPALSVAPLSGPLPDESGIDRSANPFTAQEALAAARASPQAKPFFAVLDAGYVASLAHSASRSLDRRTGSLNATTDVQDWSFTAYDGAQAMDLRVSRYVQHRDAGPATPSQPQPGLLPSPVPPPLGPSQPPPQPGQGAYDNTTVRIEASPSAAHSLMPSPDEAPRQMPTVASLFARWRAIASPAYRDLPANTWGFRILCVTTCGSLYVESQAGHASDLDTASDAGRNETRVQSELAESPTGPRGHEATLSESTLTWQQPAGGAAAPRQAQEMPTDAQVRMVESTFWIPAPAAVVAGTGGLALLAALAYLAWPAVKSAGLFGLFSRVHEAGQVQEHPTRRSMLQLAQAHPGVHVREMERRLGLGRHQCAHHLGKLREAGLVKLVPGPGYTCVFLRGTDAGLVGAAGALKAEAARRILAAALARPGLSARAAAQAAGVSLGTLSHHVPRLRAAGLVRQGPTGLTATGLAQRALAQEST